MTRRTRGGPRQKRGGEEDATGRRELADIRRAIDGLDRDIVRALDRRAALAVRTAALKDRLQLPLFQPRREAEVLDGVLSSSRVFPKTSLAAVYREIMGASLALERGMTIAVFGPAATYTHLATVRHFGHAAKLAFRSTITDVFAAVAKGDCALGVVPVENSTEGAVTHTLDNLVESPLVIAAEILLPIRHNLLVHPRTLRGTLLPVRLSRILSHPQGLAQCRNYLESRWPGVRIEEKGSTSAAAIEAARRPGVAAIASELAAEQYGLAILDAGIEDRSGNTTRFLVLRRAPEAAASARPRRGAPGRIPWKTSIAFAMKDRPGALYRMLESFQKFGVNLTKIESRPSKVAAWRYVFFLDMEGHAASPKLGKALGDLAEHCSFLRILGSYPAAADLAH